MMHALIFDLSGDFFTLPTLPDFSDRPAPHSSVGLRGVYGASQSAYNIREIHGYYGRPTTALQPMRTTKMAQLPEVFNAKDSDKMGGFEPIPAGWYLAEVVKSEMKKTKAGTGSYLNVQLKVLDGEYKGRYLFTMLNLVNPNPQAVEIAQKELASMCEACGIDEIEDSTELHGIAMAVRVGIQEGTAAYPTPKNIIRAYKAEDQMPDEDDDSPFEAA